MATTDLLTASPDADAGTDAAAEDSGQWLIEQLREEHRRADRQRLTALLTTHALPRQRTGS